jgi:hypothetical protein
MMQILEQTKEEKMTMYMKFSKKQLITMLINANDKILELIQISNSTISTTDNSIDTESKPIDTEPKTTISTTHTVLTDNFIDTEPKVTVSTIDVQPKITGLYLHYNNGNMTNVRDLPGPDYEKFLEQMNSLQIAYNTIINRP